MTISISREAMISATYTAVLTVLRDLEPTETTDAPDPGPRRVPRPLRIWLARLRLLEAVPFSHLVADSALLPAESIRFFHLDRAWTDALIEGALSVGTVTTSDRATLAEIYPVIRAEVDEAERLVRLPGWTPGAAVPAGDAGPITGFILRSRMVSGWPALSVRAYGVDNLAPVTGPKENDGQVGQDDDSRLKKLTLLRFERLAPAVLLVLFDGEPRVVHIEEPRAGVQFGVDAGDEVAGRQRMLARMRDVTNGRGLYVDSLGNPVLDNDPKAVEARTTKVPFRKGAPGVIHVTELMKRLAAEPDTKIGANSNAATFAMQMLQFPWRSVYGDQTLSNDSPNALLMAEVFRPTVFFGDLEKRFTEGPSAHPYPTQTSYDRRTQP